MLKKYWDRSKYVVLFGGIITILLLLTVVYKSDQNINKISKNIENSYDTPDLETLKNFFLKQIKSPFTNVNYEIKKGDTIQKILKKLNLENNEIQTVINQYKKYGNPNQLLVGNIIEIVVEKCHF